MGRITIFTLEDCRFCKRVKTTLSKWDIPFTEINLTDYPSKRQDMLSVSNRLTVPQVFLNDLHVGGAEETISMIEKWESNPTTSPLEVYASLVASGNDPQDPRLEPPSSPPESPPSPPPPREDVNCIQLPDGSTTSVLEMMEMLKKILPRRDLKYRFKTYKRCFRGSECIEALATEYDISRSDAEAFAYSLQTKHAMLDHVVGDHFVEDTDALFFRLQCDQQPNILNSYRKWTERVDDDVVGLVLRLKKMLGKIESAMTDNEGKVNYKQAKNHALYPAFEEAVCELQGVVIANMKENVKLAFCINLYNLMIKYAFMKVGIGTTGSSRLNFFNNVSMQVGFDVLSFQDLENGVLRDNRKAPYALQKQFHADDDRLRLTVDHVDNRIHFALNCGAASCPPVKAFHAESIEEELRIIAQAFCEDDSNVRIDPETSEVHLSSIFNWYKEDFCGPSGKSSDLLPIILPFLRDFKKQNLEVMINSGKKVKVIFNKYNWTSDASSFVPFSGGNLRANSTRFL